MCSSRSCYYYSELLTSSITYSSEVRAGHHTHKSTLRLCILLYVPHRLWPLDCLPTLMTSPSPAPALVLKLHLPHSQCLASSHPALRLFVLLSGEIFSWCLASPLPPPLSLQPCHYPHYHHPLHSPQSGPLDPASRASSWLMSSLGPKRCQGA